MSLDYYQKYLKYKNKYLQLKQQIGGGFQDVWKDINLTDDHLIELFGSREMATGKDTIDGIILAFDKMSEMKDGKEIFAFGITNRDKQPKWYKDNPIFFTIYKNKEYFDSFNDALNTIEKKSTGQKGGAGGRNKREAKKEETKLEIIGRIFGGTALVIGVIALAPILISSAIIKGIVDSGKCTEKDKRTHSNYC